MEGGNRQNNNPMSWTERGGAASASEIGDFNLFIVSVQYYNQRLLN